MFFVVVKNKQRPNSKVITESTNEIQQNVVLRRPFCVLLRLVFIQNWTKIISTTKILSLAYLVTDSFRVNQTVTN